jgi:sugar/nucleoside kinase (ribokinase family)
MPNKQLTPGGAALNSARCANHCLRKMGIEGEVAFIGCVAKDDAGDILQQTLKD